MDDRVLYRLISFDLTRFEPSYDKFDENDLVGIGSEFDFGYSADSHFVKCCMNLHFTQDKETVLKTQLLSFIEIKEESVQKMIKDDKIVLSRDMLIQFASFGYGAMRGIMYLKTINTPFQGVILPPIELGKVFTKQVEISLK